MNFHFKSHSESANGLARSNQPQVTQYQLHQREPQLQSSIYQYHNHNQSTGPQQRQFQLGQHQPQPTHHNHHYTSQSQANGTGYPSPAQRHFHNQQPHPPPPPPPTYQSPPTAPAAQQPPAQQQHYQQQSPATADRRYQSQLLQPTSHQQQPPQQLQSIMNQSTNPGHVSQGSTDSSIIREFSDSQQSLDRLFNPPTTEASVPLRQRNLPSSFFNPRPINNGVRGDLHCRSTSFDLRPPPNSVHMRTQSVLAPMTGILSDSTGSNGLLHSSGYYSSSSNSLQQPVESLSRHSSGTIAPPQSQPAAQQPQETTQTLANVPTLTQRQPQTTSTQPASQQQYTNFSPSYAPMNGHPPQQNGRSSYVSEFNSNNYFMETTQSQEQGYNQAQATCTYNGDLYNQTSVYPNQVAFSPTSDQGVFDWNETSM